MKLAHLKLLPVLAFLFSITFGSCSDTENRATEDEYREELQDNTEESLDEENEGRRIRLSDRIRNLETELDREIRELDQKIESGTAAEKVKWQIRREKLAMEREQLKNDLDNIGKEISNDWKQLENDIADRLDRISQDLRDDN